MYDSVYSVVLKEYEKKRAKAMDEADKKRKDLRELYPEFAKLEDDLNLYAIEQAKSIITKSGIDKQVIEENLEGKINELNILLEKFLINHGLPKDYLVPAFECKKCSDTGYISVNRCN